MPSLTRSLSFVALLAVAALLAGCKSAPKGEGADAASRLQSLAASVRSGESRLQETITSLNNMTTSPSEVQLQFKAFDNALGRLDKQADRISSAAQSMTREVDRYMKEWSEEVAKINNEDIRARSDARRKQVETQLTKLRTDYQALADAYKPVMLTLTDIRTALRADLTVAGVKAIADEAKLATEQAGRVLQQAEAVSADLQAVGVQMAGGE